MKHGEIQIAALALDHYRQCSVVLQAAIMDMVDICIDDQATPEEQRAAREKLREALWPNDCTEA